MLTMEQDTRRLIDHLGSELARIMEDASVTAALLRGVPPHELGEALAMLATAADQCQALVGAMHVLADDQTNPINAEGRTR